MKMKNQILLLSEDLKKDVLFSELKHHIDCLVPFSLRVLFLQVLLPLTVDDGFSGVLDLMIKFIHEIL